MGTGPSPGWETNINLTVLPHFGLVTSNQFQLFMLDGNNVIDYVQFTGPNSFRDLNAELTSPDQNDPNGLWQKPASRQNGGRRPRGV